MNRLYRRTRPVAGVLVTVVAAVLAVLVGCEVHREDDGETLFDRMEPERTGIHFVNQLEEDDDLNVVSFEAFFNGAGVGVGDVNGDDLPDVFFASNRGDNRLYVNEGDFRFRDVTADAGFVSHGRWANGVSMVDINLDGHLDIYISCGGPFADPDLRANELWINTGDGAFTERAGEYGLDDRGVTIHAAFLDYDADGDLDVYLLTNGVGDTPPNVVVPKKTGGESVTTDRLYRNEGDGTFSNVSEQAGIHVEGYGLGVAVSDVDGDGWPDVYVANDYLSNDLLYVNNRDGTFTDRAAELFRHQSFAAMGADVADINNDGLPDIMTADMLAPTNAGIKRMYGDSGYDRRRSELEAGYDRQVSRNTLQLNNGVAQGASLPSFSEIGLFAGVESTNWSWSVLFGDFDNDGWRDLLVTNGIPRDITNLDFAEYKMRQLRASGHDPGLLSALAQRLRQIDGIHAENVLFRNQRDLTFAEVSEEWGFDIPSYSTGAAYADLDNDGDLDLVISNQNEPASIYKNNVRERDSGNYLQVSLEGPAANPDGLGTLLVAHHSGQAQHHQHTLYRGYLSTVGSAIHFGLGSSTLLDSLVIKWPDGRRQTLVGVASNQRIAVHYDRSREAPAPQVSAVESLFTEVTRERGISFQHAESHYNDFKLQPLVPHKFSQSGPAVAVGDVDGDGMDDVFVGGAFSQQGRLYVQAADGTFRPRDVDAGFSTRVSGPKHFEEDMGAVFFDSNGDGHLDLYVASGGSEFEAGSRYYQDRLYLGDGRGGFAEAPDALPDLTSSSSVVAAGDFDGDGDLDLFVGGRVVPNRYPEPPRSFILENRGGTFVDVTRAVAPGLADAGLVTTALWTDFNDDGGLDLILAGEWMPITFYENRSGRLTDVTGNVGISDTVGWWNSLVAGDFDRDGDTDYVAGNLGLNTFLRNVPAGPVRLHVKDVNRDGRIDAVLSRYVDGISYPVHLRDDLLDQLPGLASRFPTNDSYAGATIDDLFTTDESRDMLVYESDTFASAYIENRGNSTFALQPLPAEAQLAPVFGMAVDDYDLDGNLDLAMVGNSFANEAFIGPYDAFSGLVLLGDGEGRFSATSMEASGLFVDGDGKALAALTGAGGERLLLASQNGDALRVYRVNRSTRVLKVEEDDVRAEVTHADESKEKIEFYYGTGYLSQSTRSMTVSEHVREVLLFDRRGESRRWQSGPDVALVSE